MKKIIISLFILINLYGCGVPVENGDDKLIYEDVLKKYVIENTDLMKINNRSDMIQKIKFNDGINCIIYRPATMSDKSGGISCVVLKD